MIWPRTEKPPWKGQWGSVHATLGVATSTPMSRAFAIVISPCSFRSFFGLELDVGARDEHAFPVGGHEDELLARFRDQDFGAGGRLHEDRFLLLVPNEP